MNNYENIYIKIEINKDPSTGQINLIARFDPNAPNFIKDENGFWWIPTSEERKFINESFEMIQRKR